LAHERVAATYFCREADRTLAVKRDDAALALHLRKQARSGSATDLSDDQQGDRETDLQADVADDKALQVLRFTVDRRAAPKSVSQYWSVTGRKRARERGDGPLALAETAGRLLCDASEALLPPDAHAGMTEPAALPLDRKVLVFAAEEKVCDRGVAV
jgi:hypothetical protein